MPGMITALYTCVQLDKVRPASCLSAAVAAAAAAATGHVVVAALYTCGQLDKVRLGCCRKAAAAAACLCQRSMVTCGQLAISVLACSAYTVVSSSNININSSSNYAWPSILPHMLLQQP
jgi:hypothetical protein